MKLFGAIRCRLGWHRDLVKESRTFHRRVTVEGESIDAHEQKECRCGHVFEYEQHTTTRSVSATIKPERIEP